MAKVKEARRTFFVMTSHGDDEMKKHSEGVAETIDQACLAAGIDPWKRDDEADRCFVELYVRGIVNRVTVVDPEKLRERVVKASFEFFEMMRFGSKMDSDFGVRVDVEVEVKDGVINAVFLGDDDNVLYSFAIVKPEVV